MRTAQLLDSVQQSEELAVDLHEHGLGCVAAPRAPLNAPTPASLRSLNYAWQRVSSTLMLSTSYSMFTGSSHTTSYARPAALADPRRLLLPLLPLTLLTLLTRAHAICQITVPGDAHGHERHRGGPCLGHRQKVASHPPGHARWLLSH
jgi:hypothetical protein